MTRLILILILFTLAACGQEYDIPNINYVVDDRYSELVDQFYQDYSRFTGRYDYKFVGLVFDDVDLADTNNPGLCVQLKSKKTGAVLESYIKIPKDYWFIMSPNYQKTVVYHELGHCVLGLDHGEGGPIMNRSINSSFVITDEHLELLFQGVE